MKVRFFTGVILLALTVSQLAGVAGDNPGKEKFNSKSQYGFIENKGHIIDQDNNPNPAVLYLLNSTGMNVQLRRGGFSYGLYRITNIEQRTANGEILSHMTLHSRITTHVTDSLSIQ